MKLTVWHFAAGVAAVVVGGLVLDHVRRMKMKIPGVCQKAAAGGSGSGIADYLNN